jgi:hypothetical protein
LKKCTIKVVDADGQEHFFTSDYKTEYDYHDSGNDNTTVRIVKRDTGAVEWDKVASYFKPIRVEVL